MSRGLLHSPVRVVKGPGGLLPTDGSVVGDQVKDNFIADLLQILGDCRLLLLYDGADTTTTTSVDRNARTLAHDATIAGNLSQRGSGLSREMDGSADQGDIPDNDDFSFGDGASDQAFSIVALVDTDVTNAKGIILGKIDLTTGAELREWQAYIDSSGQPTFEMWDESANARIGRLDATALTADTFVLLGFTYDGAGSNAGISIFRDAALLDDTDSSTGAYVAMENLAEVLQVGFEQSTSGADGSLWNGDMALVALCAKELTIDEMWQIKSLINGFFDLSL